MYLLAPFIVQNFLKILTAVQSSEDASFSGPKLVIGLNKK